jgi:hypothetical protein
MNNCIVLWLVADARRAGLCCSAPFPGRAISHCVATKSSKSIRDASCLTELEPARPQLSHKAGLYRFRDVRSRRRHYNNTYCHSRRGCQLVLTGTRSRHAFGSALLLSCLFARSLRLSNIIEAQPCQIVHVTPTLCGR